MRPVHLFFATLTPACMVSGLSHPGPIEAHQQALEAADFSERLAREGLPERFSGDEPALPWLQASAEPDLPLGDYMQEVLVVHERHQGRTDLDEGARWMVLLEPARGGWLLDHDLFLEDQDGQLSGGGQVDEADVTLDCTVYRSFVVDGAIVAEGHFHLTVAEEVFAGGKDCETSLLGPARYEQNRYRAQYTWVP